MYDILIYMERHLIDTLHDFIGKTVRLGGSIASLRDHGKLLFVDLRDRTGTVQCFMPASHAAFEEVRSLPRESILSVSATVQERPEKNRTEGENGDLECVITSVSVLSKARDLPFDPDAEVNLDTCFDYRPITLRRERDRALFRVQSCIVNAFRGYLMDEDFIEFQAPGIVGGDAEGGAEVFSVEYFDTKASLATSPQLYKQILVGVHERVFSVGEVFRAEKHSTSRHLNEYTSMDFEMGYIDDYVDVMRVLEGCMRRVAERVAGMKEALALLGADPAVLPDGSFPVMKLSAAQHLLTRQYGISCEGEPDLSPEHERMLCEHALKEHGSDFIFITHYPTAKRPMYAYEDEDDPGYTKSFDLLFRGVEISSGGQRVHDYDVLVGKMKEKMPGVDPEKVFAFYLQAFKYGMPPHGGMGMGLERLTAKLTGVPNAKEASAFPRDRNRIDIRLYE